MINIITTTTDSITLVIISNKFKDGAKLYTGANSNILEELIDKYEYKLEEIKEYKEYIDAYEEEYDDEVAEEMFDDYVIDCQNLEGAEEDLNDILEEFDIYFNPNKHKDELELKEVEEFIENNESRVFNHTEEVCETLRELLKNEKDTYNVVLNTETNMIDVNKEGSNVFMPELLLRTLLSTNNYTKYLLFWDRCLANPIPYIRQQLFNWIYNNGLNINDNGLLVGYRSGIKLTSLMDKIKEQECLDNKQLLYNKGESCEDFNNIDNYAIISNTKLKTNYLPIFAPSNDSWKTESIFTHWYSDNKTTRKFFTLNNIYGEDRVDINPDNSCSNGIHCAGIKYSINSFGDTALACLLCPSKVASVPNDDATKVRAYEIFPFMELSNVQEFHDKVSDETSEEYKLVCNINYNPSIEETLLNVEGKESSNGVEYIICDIESDEEITLKEYEERKKVLLAKIELDKAKILNDNVPFSNIIKSKNVDLS